MKKNLMMTLAAVMFTAGVVVFSSCSKDDDEGSGSTSAGVLDKKSGLRLYKCGKYSFYYTEKGMLNYIRDSYGRWTFSYGPNTIKYDEGGDGESVADVTYNSSGYLTSIYGSSTGQDGSDTWVEESKTTMAYDGYGHLTTITAWGKETGTDNGKHYSDTWNGTYKLIWRNGLLEGATYNYKDVDDGDVYIEKKDWTYTYDKSDNENTFLQWTPSICGCLGNDEGYEDCFALVGLMGVGPSLLPSKGERVGEWEEDGRTHNSDYTENYTYGFNSNGSVSFNYVNKTRYDFSYDYADYDLNKLMHWTETNPQTESKAVERISHMFSKRHHAKSRR